MERILCSGHDRIALRPLQIYLRFNVSLRSKLVPSRDRVRRTTGAHNVSDLPPGRAILASPQTRLVAEHVSFRRLQLLVDQVDCLSTRTRRRASHRVVNFNVR